MLKRFFGQGQTSKTALPMEGKTGAKFDRRGNSANLLPNPGHPSHPDFVPSPYHASTAARLWHGSDADRARVQQKVTVVGARVEALSSGAVTFLLALHSLFEQWDFKSVSRAEIAAAIHHPYLYRYDRKLLQKLLDDKFIRYERVPLSKLRQPGRTGSEFRYSMTIDVGFLIHLVRTASQPGQSNG